jgi:hypothetical protein
MIEWIRNLFVKEAIRTTVLTREEVEQRGLVSFGDGEVDPTKGFEDTSAADLNSWNEQAFQLAEELNRSDDE